MGRFLMIESPAEAKARSREEDEYMCRPRVTRKRDAIRLMLLILLTVALTIGLLLVVTPHG